jgi:hypothetical protein
MAGCEGQLDAEGQGDGMQSDGGLKEGMADVYGAPRAIWCG